MSQSRRERIRTVTVVLALALVAAACVRPEEPGVAMKPLDAKLVFGVVKAEVPARPPAQAAVDLTESNIEVFGELPIPEADDLLFLGEDEETAPCPEPRADDTPERINQNFIPEEARPATGLYRWLRESWSEGEGGQPENYQVGFGRHRLMDIKEVSDTVYQYKSVQPYGDEAFLVSVYEVNTAGFTVNDPGLTGGIVQTPRTGEPERGMTLQSFEIQDANGQLVPGTRSFQPETGVLLLPLPVTSDEEYQSVAVDQKSGSTLVHQVKTVFEQRVNACGELVDGWLVSAQQTFSTANAAPVTIFYDYVIAAAYGGLIVSERSQNDSGDVVKLTIAQLKPTS